MPERWSMDRANDMQDEPMTADPPAYVYVLGCLTPRGPITYVGWTNDLDARLAKHNAGAGAKNTRGRVWRLLYAERYPNKIEAMSREWALKRDRALRLKLRAAC